MMLDALRATLVADRCRPSRAVVPLVAAAAMLLLAGPSVAQPADEPAGDAPSEPTAEPPAEPMPPLDPADEPTLRNPALDQAERELTERSGPGLEVAPTDAAVALPGVNEGDLAPTSGGVIREGALLDDRRGMVRPLKGGGWAFVFDPDETGDRERPMILMPSIRLNEMRRLVEASREPVTFRVSGRVFAYERRNYLLPTFFTTVADRRADPAGDRGPQGNASNAAGDADEPGSQTFDSTGDPEIDELLAEVEQATAEEGAGPTGVRTDAGDGAPPQSPPTPARPNVEPNEDFAQAGDSGPILREGQVIANRRGRLTRAAGGGWAIVFDTDADRDPAGPNAGEPGAAALDAAIELLPCQNLQGMRRIVERSGDRVVFSITGTVYVYDSTPYLLPTMYLVEIDRTGNVTSAQ